MGSTDPGGAWSAVPVENTVRALRRLAPGATLRRPGSPELRELAGALRESEPAELAGCCPGAVVSVVLAGQLRALDRATTGLFAPEVSGPEAARLVRAARYSGRWRPDELRARLRSEPGLRAAALGWAEATGRRVLAAELRGAPVVPTSEDGRLAAEVVVRALLPRVEAGGGGREILAPRAAAGGGGGGDPVEPRAAGGGEPVGAGAAARGRDPVEPGAAGGDLADARAAARGGGDPVEPQPGGGGDPVEPQPGGGGDPAELRPRGGGDPAELLPRGGGDPAELRPRGGGDPSEPAATRAGGCGCEPLGPLLHPEPAEGSSPDPRGTFLDVRSVRVTERGFRVDVHAASPVELVGDRENLTLRALWWNGLGRVTDDLGHEYLVLAKDPGGTGTVRHWCHPRPAPGARVLRLESAGYRGELLRLDPAAHGTSAEVLVKLELTVRLGA